MVGLYLSSAQERRKDTNRLHPMMWQKLAIILTDPAMEKYKKHLFLILSDIIYHFALNEEKIWDYSNEILDTFSIQKNSNDEEYVSINVQKCQGVSRMYAIENKEKCPIECFKRYMEVLPEST